MRNFFAFPLILFAGMVAGCSASSYCKGTLPYQQAESIPPIQGVDELKIPESQAALKIPPPPASAAPYGETYRDEKGKKRTRCLDIPPSMPEPADKDKKAG